MGESVQVAMQTHRLLFNVDNNDDDDYGKADMTLPLHS